MGYVRLSTIGCFSQKDCDSTSYNYGKLVMASPLHRLLVNAHVKHLEYVKLLLLCVDLPYNRVKPKFFEDLFRRSLHGGRFWIGNLMG